jgi:ion channel
MYGNWLANSAVVAATLLTVVAAVLVHYEGLITTWKNVNAFRGKHRSKMLYAIGSVIVLHVIEIWLFGLVMWALVQWPACGRIIGADDSLFFDLIYLSAMSYTTVGFGDVAPVGPIRFLTGTEALTGFVLIAWSASFTYLEMERFWKAD